MALYGSFQGIFGVVAEHVAPKMKCDSVTQKLATRSTR